MNNIAIISLAFAIAALVVTLVITFIIPKEYKKLAAIITILIIALGTLVYFFDFCVLSIISIISIILNLVFYRKSNFIEQLECFFKEKYKRKEYAEIIRWNKALSRPLWLSYNLSTRIRIGEYVARAAPLLDNKEALARALINEIGWTKVELLDYQDAENKIKEGIEVVKNEKNDYMVYMKAVGYRHLFGLYIRKGNNLEKAENYLNESFRVISTLSSNYHGKVELMAEHYFAKALLEYHRGQHSEALEDIEKAEQGYKNLPDKEWQIKIMARKGDIILASQRNNNIDNAITIFEEGLNKSQEYQYLQQKVQNLKGLGACYVAKGKECYNEAKKNLTEAKKIAEKLSLNYELGNIEKLLSDLNKHKNSNNKAN